MNYVNYLESVQEAAKLSFSGQMNQAISKYLDALALAPKEEDKLEPLFALGVELKEENPEDALVYLEQCSVIAKDFDKSSFFYCYFYNAEKELGDICVQQKHFPKALLHFKKAYKEIKSLQDDPETEKYLDNMIKLMEKKSA